MVTCHCSRCRKAGASTFVLVEAGTFRWLQGREYVSTLRVTEPYKYDRSFCARCGTALGEVGSTSGRFPVPANCLDTDLPIRPRFHEFVAEKPSWYAICDDAPQFALHPTGV